MEIRLRPEIENLIKHDVQCGPYQSIDEFVERAVSMLHDQEVWLSQNRDQIAAKIERGYAAAERGELIEGDDARSRLNDLKRSAISKTPR